MPAKEIVQSALKKVSLTGNPLMKTVARNFGQFGEELANPRETLKYITRPRTREEVFKEGTKLASSFSFAGHLQPVQRIISPALIHSRLNDVAAKIDYLSTGQLITKGQYVSELSNRISKLKVPIQRPEDFVNAVSREASRGRISSQMFPRVLQAARETAGDLTMLIKSGASIFQ